MVVILGHFLLVLSHPLKGLVYDFVQIVQVQLQLIFVALFIKEFPPEVGESYFNRDDCFCAIS